MWKKRTDLRKGGGIFLCMLFVFLPVFFGSFISADASGTEPARLSDQQYITAEDWPEGPDIGAGSAVLLEAETGTVLYAKNADTKRYPASITKILTSLITLEESSLSDPLVFEGEALDPLPDGYVSIHPTAGETMSVEDCLYGVLLESANDAANALAVHNAGTLAGFAEKMNQRALKAGAKHTHFSNPSGLADSNHYTTAYDMAMILRACVQNEEFVKIAGSVDYTIPATNKHAARYVKMRHEMLKPGSPYYDASCIAGKTGFTTPSGYTLVTYAEKNGMKLVCCVMQCEKGVQYESTRALLDYGFHSFHVADDGCMKAEESHLRTGILALDQIQGSRDFSLEKAGGSLFLPKGTVWSDLDLAVKELNPKEEEDGCFLEAECSYEGMKLGTLRLRMTRTKSSEGAENSNGIRQSINRSEQRRFYGSLVGIALVLIFACMVVFFVWKKRKNKKRQAVKQEGEVMDFNHAKEVFERYLDGYDREDERIRLKIVHTYCVVDCMEEITVRMGLPEEEKELAMMIALLHDIGRFEQVKRYQSFEPATMDHAQEGVRILFEEGMIREFVQTDQYDSIIRTAIARHSDYKLEGITDERTLLHAKLIRDADKLDNCRVKLEDSMEVLLNKTAEEVGKEAISDEVFAAACEKHSIYSPDRKTAMDYWVSYIVYVYDINFKETLQIIREKNYMHDIIARIPYSNEDTKEKMKRIERDVEDYLVQKTME